MSRLELLGSARHKLRLARYHGVALLAVLGQNVPDDPEHELRIALEAHLEGIGYTGTAATEKTIRSLNPERVPERGTIESMILEARRSDLTNEEEVFVSRFDDWWFGRGRGTRYAQRARDLRNDAAHTSYEKAPLGPRWQMRIRGNPRPIDLETFAEGCLAELDGLDDLVSEAEQLAAAAVA